MGHTLLLHITDLCSGSLNCNLHRWHRSRPVVGGVRKPWFSDPGPLDAAMAAAKHALPACKFDSDRIPSLKDIHLPLSSAQHEARAGGSEYLAKWRRTVGTSRFLQARGLADQEARLEPFVIVGHYCVGFMFPGAVSARVFEAMACTMATFFMADDLCFDEDLPDFRPGDVHRGDLGKARAFIRAWCHALRADVPPGPGDGDVARLQAWAGSSGRELRSISSPDCFHAVMDAVDSSVEACLAMREDIGACTRDLESYSRVRAYNGACFPLCVMAEIAVQELLPAHVRAHPGIQKLAWAACLHVSLLNDIFSYHKDVAAAAGSGSGSGSGSPLVYNLLAVLMRSEGLEPLQALRRAVEMVNSYSYAMLQAEAELPAAWESSAVDSAVRRHVLALKELASGHFYFCTRTLPERFRWPDLSRSNCTSLSA